MSAEGISGTAFSAKKTLTDRQRQQENSLLRATLLDSLMFAGLIAAALASGSMTALAEVLRGAFMLTVEIISLVTMLRDHRGKFVEFEYGIGKIERIVTIVIAGGLFISALYTLGGSWGRLSDPSALPTPGMIFAVIVASTNMTVNFFCVGDFVRANSEEESLILDAQIKARVVKTMASVIVVVVLVIAMWLSDPKAASLVDAIGGFIAAGYMIAIGRELLQESLPDLMDRSLPEKEQLMLLKVVAAVCLVLAHQRFLQNKGLVLLFLTSLLAN
ncbi:MAG: cation transporter, partial [Xanthomonadales bacterium]|nr:cation transporter [Xanthomonadales bacterium]